MNAPFVHVLWNMMENRLSSEVRIWRRISRLEKASSLSWVFGKGSYGFATMNTELPYHSLSTATIPVFVFAPRPNWSTLAAIAPMPPGSDEGRNFGQPDAHRFDVKFPR